MLFVFFPILLIILRPLQFILWPLEGSWPLGWEQMILHARWTNECICEHILYNPAGVMSTKSTTKIENFALWFGTNQTSRGTGTREHVLVFKSDIFVICTLSNYNGEKNESLSSLFACAIYYGDTFKTRLCNLCWSTPTAAISNPVTVARVEKSHKVSEVQYLPTVC